ncbi:MAG: CBS domain-containing protein [Pirellulales bacterium]|nr:CBS domain-containing protein [Pirellulales bacterium]
MAATCARSFKVRKAFRSPGTSMIEVVLVLAACSAVLLIGYELFGRELLQRLDFAGGAAIAKTVDNAIPNQPLIRTELVLLLLGLVVVISYAISLRKKLYQQKDFHAPPLDPQQLQEIENRRYNKRQQIFKVLEADLDALFLSHMEVKQLMSQPVNYVLPETTVQEVRNLMKAEQVHHYAVCNATGELLGVVSDRDVLRSHNTTAVADIMSQNPVTVRANTRVNPAITMMINHGFSCLLVTDEKKLVGVLTTTDLVMTLQAALQILSKNEQQTLEKLSQATPIASV